MDFIDAIRELYNTGEKPRVLYICPMPPYKRADRKTVVYDIRERYEAIFSEEEQSRFNMLNIYHNYPRFFDRETLACFYRNSKIFVHTASDERRCRVAGYAWATGMPVVGKKCVGSLLPAHLRKPPFFYEVGNNDITYAKQIISALRDVDAGSRSNSGWSECEQEFAMTFTVPKFISKLETYFNINKLVFEGELLANNLDHRLGRHHGLGISTNSVNQNLGAFMQSLLDISGECRDKMRRAEFAEECLLQNPNSRELDLNFYPLSYRIKSNLPKKLARLL